MLVVAEEGGLSRLLGLSTLSSFIRRALKKFCSESSDVMMFPVLIDNGSERLAPRVESRRARLM